MRSGGRTSVVKSLVERERDTEVRKQSAITCLVSLAVHMLHDLNARGGVIYRRRMKPITTRDL